MSNVEFGPRPERGWVLIARAFEDTGDLMLFNGDLLADPLDDKPILVHNLEVNVTCSCHEGSRHVAIRSYSKRGRKGKRPTGSRNYYAIVLNPGGAVRGPALKKYLDEHSDVKFEVL